MKIPSKFLSKLRNLKNYFILKENEEYFIMGTYVTLRINSKTSQNVFQPNENNVNKNFPLFFALTTTSSNKEIEKLKNLGILIIHLDKTIFDASEDMIEVFLDDYMLTKFKN